MSVRVMTAVFDHSESRLADRLVLLVIADRSDDDGTGCYRGKESISRMARVSRTTVTEALARLEALGEIQVEHRPGRTSLYRVTLPGVGQNPADPPEAEGAEIRPTPGHPAGRGSATRPAAIHPYPSSHPRNEDTDWRPDHVAPPPDLSHLREKIAKGRSDVKVPGERPRADLD